VISAISNCYFSRLKINRRFKLSGFGWRTFGGGFLLLLLVWLLLLFLYGTSHHHHQPLSKLQYSRSRSAYRVCPAPPSFVGLSAGAEPPIRPVVDHIIIIRIHKELVINTRLAGWLVVVVVVFPQ
jgi:hypothetical protein